MGDRTAPGMGQLPKARPICLINQLGKIFEWILADRMKAWKNTHPESNLSPRQFGFREGRSTCDALIEDRDCIKAHVNREQLVIAISLDVANAFNSIPWETIKGTLRRKTSQGT